MRDESDKTIEHEIQAIGEQLFGSGRSTLEDKLIRSFAETRIISVNGEDFPEWFDDKDERNRVVQDGDIIEIEKWPFQNVLRLDLLLRFLELDLVRSFATSQTVVVRSALLEESPDMRRSVPFALEFHECRWSMGLYLRGLDVISLKFNRCSGADLTFRRTTAEGGITISGGRIHHVWLEHVDCHFFSLNGCETWKFWADYVQVTNIIAISVESSDLQWECFCYISRVKTDRCSIEYIKVDAISLLSAQILKRLEIKAEICLCEDVDPAGLLDLNGSKVGGELLLEGVVAAPDGIIDLTDVTADILYDGTKTWPTNGTIRLSGLQYREIRRVETLKGKSEVDPTVIFPVRMEWLNRQSDWKFSLHPYRQLAGSFIAQGHPRLAARVMAKGAGKLRRNTRRGRFAAIWNGIMGATTGYGYRPELSLRWLALFLVIGATVIHCAYMAELMATMDDEPPTTFNAVVYSLDALLPVIDFDQAKFWVPNGKGTLGVLVQIYGWIHTVMGWVLATLAIAAFSGLLRKVD